MATLITNIASLITVDAAGQRSRTGAAMREIGEIRDGAILFDDTIRWIGTSEDALSLLNDEARLTALGIVVADLEIVDAEGRTVLPGFVDSHTHVVFAGSRATEFARRLQGVSYQEIAAEGGGILATVNAVRDASVEDLVHVGEGLVHSAMEHGTTTMEIKSGYGLTLDSELRQLEAVAILNDTMAPRIMATFMGAHDVPPEYRDRREAYVDHIIDDMLPRVAEQGIAQFCDAFVDTGYFTNDDGRRIAAAAKAHGLIPKIHADELSAFGAAEMAAESGAISADHLLFASEAGIESMKKHGTVATLLPGTAYTLRLPYAPARRMIDAGAVVALATDCNPGSCFCENMQQIISLACMNMGMSIEEAITASTLHGAAALGVAEYVGSLEVGKMADIVMYDVAGYADLVYHFGTNKVVSVWIEGEEQ
ncbi:MAG: imidazolonepropionase ['Candidatus Kapabacteria' thiocyanatum]|uniref:Imidazolonepropionase n=1 Tax=Candidatus Kapaibacterium thiocyanatum TaxID=1895771 RepID=A0A1M3KWM5_9BACT|nr:imidazolonepropionase ['Candidatus Kapabacteria' thiocyanatum]OJX56836.1 MAG: imidazolonepropionase ['Candidatus Kapabacteria' thiocyanatum]